MKVLAYGDIMDGGVSVFTAVAKIDDSKLMFSFSGVIRIDNPYRHLEDFINEMDEIVSIEKIDAIEFDFNELNFCNSNGFYVIMDITELIINNVKGPIIVKRTKDDDWQQETLPILLNTDEPEIENRITFLDIQEI